MNKLSKWLEQHITLQNRQGGKDEKENAISHLIGIVASLIYLIIIIVKKNSFATKSTFIGLLIYSFTLLLLYSSSTFYHALKVGNAKRLFRLFDHSNIYLLIAGTYTPLLLYVGSRTTFYLCLMVWAIAFLGIVLKVLFWGRYKVLHVVFYLLMGWMILFFWDKVIPFINKELTYFVLAAGLSYTIGVIFYAMKKVKHTHLIWHIFTLIASSLFSIGFLLHLI